MKGRGSIEACGLTTRPSSPSDASARVSGRSRGPIGLLFSILKYPMAPVGDPDVVCALTKLVPGSRVGLGRRNVRGLRQDDGAGGGSWEVQRAGLTDMQVAYPPSRAVRLAVRCIRATASGLLFVATMPRRPNREDDGGAE